MECAYDSYVEGRGMHLGPPARIVDGRMNWARVEGGILEGVYEVGESNVRKGKNKKKRERS